ncbi:hypothetical protein Cgig2_023982 [Carnegiea gigantea]|uniref:CCHC-type domain-containing protein n=1 Tax=Carnegiea gigantea TaxID=171969 RepID=A0A9Q1QFG8_9CARY|nr:hypothetical protein Cgig2_023982 [Carnegiea gigantea]
MADELMIEWEKLKLTKEEEEAADYEEEIAEERKEEIALSLLGKFLTPNTFSTKAMKTAMQVVWRPSRGMVVKELDKNLFLFQFFLKKDKDFALDKGPWAFDGHLLIMKEWTGTAQLLDIVFDKTGFWVKAYDVPAVRQTRVFAKFLGDKVGTFLRCDDNELLGTEKALCFRAEVDVLKSLQRGVMVKIDGMALWIKFKYSKLPDFCYGCGVLGHTLKACEVVDLETPTCSGEGNLEKEHTVQMVIDDGDVRIPPGDVFKCKLADMGRVVGCDRVRVVETSAGKNDTYLEQAEVARQPRQDQC